MNRFLRFVALIAIVFGFALPISAQTNRPVSYNRDVKPILSNRCFACHGFDEKHREADLRLDDSEAAHASGVLKADDKGVISILDRMTSTDPEKQMPPPAAKKPILTAEEIAIVKRWVSEGAKYDKHWSFTAPVKIDPPAGDAANVDPIDRFIAARLKEESLTFSPPADPRTLLRRLSYDLTGLPPTTQDVNDFSASPSDEAYARAVDRLLASSAYGERMAAYWLDLVRFADSAGYHSDNPRNIAPYRDYVIQAFNANLPFDQFAREQLAGDLLPNPTMWQKVASGYNRLLQTTEEGGAQPKEYTAKYAADRVRNFGSAWLALTTGCCECHSHKFDPLTIRDFYSLAAFFADIQEAAVGRREPGMPVPSDQQKAELDRLLGEITQLDTRLKTAAEAEAMKFETSHLAPLAIEWTTLKFEEPQVQGESKLKPLDDGSFKSFSKVAATEILLFTGRPEQKQITGIRLEALADDELPSKGPGTAPNGNFVLTEIKATIVPAKGKETPLKFTRAAADFSQDSWHVSGAIDGKSNTGWAVLGAIGVNHTAIFQLEKPLELPENAKLRISLEFQSPHPQHNIGRLRLSATESSQPAESEVSKEIRDLAAIPSDQRKPEQIAKLGAFVRERSPALEADRNKLRELQTAKTKLEESFPKTLISMSGAPRTIRVLARGNWLDDSGEEVLPAIPAALGKLETGDRRATRLDLAEWLVNKKNPLTARVFVNRMWKLMFGRGLVKSAEDFGAQGEYPSHPELLDALALDFMESGWNVKQLMRRIALTQTYRQASLATQKDRDRDPNNALLARQSRFRLEAEAIRDQALDVSGLLVRKIGGASVKPYQPAGYWSYLNFPTREWQNDSGESLYRRTLYTHWQRTFPHPALVAFDAPSREECTVDRPRSNTPLQALVLLNDPTYVEASRVLAAETIGEGSDSASRLEFLFRRVLQRNAREDEFKLLSALVEQHEKQFAADEKGARELLKIGAKPAPDSIPPAQLAAWTNVVRIVLNLHETITRN